MKLNSFQFHIKTSSIAHTANNNQNHNNFIIIKKKDYKEPGDLDLATFCQNLEFKWNMNDPLQLELWNFRGEKRWALNSVANKIDDSTRTLNGSHLSYWDL
jgi:hypothetical protein